MRLIFYIHISLFIGLRVLISSREPKFVLHLCTLFGLHLLFLTAFIFVRIMPDRLISYFECWLVLIQVVAYELWWCGWCSMVLLDTFWVRYLVWYSLYPTWYDRSTPFPTLLCHFLFFLFVHSYGYLGFFSFLFSLSCGYLGLWLYGWSILRRNLGFVELCWLWSPLIMLWFCDYLLVVDI